MCLRLRAEVIGVDGVVNNCRSIFRPRPIVSEPALEIVAGKYPSIHQINRFRGQAPSNIVKCILHVRHYGYGWKLSGKEGEKIGSVVNFDHVRLNRV